MWLYKNSKRAFKSYPQAFQTQNYIREIARAVPHYRTHKWDPLVHETFKHYDLPMKIHALFFSVPMSFYPSHQYGCMRTRKGQKVPESRRKVLCSIWDVWVQLQDGTRKHSLVTMDCTLQPPLVRENAGMCIWPSLSFRRWGKNGKSYLCI